jgi:hypothetical protein
VGLSHLTGKGKQIIEAAINIGLRKCTLPHLLDANGSLVQHILVAHCTVAPKQNYSSLPSVQLIPSPYLSFYLFTAHNSELP